jgi:transketolase
MVDLERIGVRFDLVTAQLEDEGIQKFIDPFDRVERELAAMPRRALAFPDLDRLQSAARRLRRLVIRMTTEAGSGHPTSCMSCADIVAALFFSEMRWDPSDPAARNVDAFVLSKGHAAPILWAALHEAGAIAEDPLSLRRIDSTLEGHPTPNNPWVRVATGSLGQGLAAANGMALANRLDARIFCLLGDGECSEGSVWEAAQFAALNGLSNLVAIVDVNGLGQSEAAPYRHDTGVFCPAVRIVRLACRRDRRTRHGGHPGRAAAGPRCGADRDHRPNREGQGGLVPRGRKRMARQGARPRPDEQGARGAR